MVDDQLFREVEEELRKERLAAVWDRYGVMALIGLGVIKPHGLYPQHPGGSPAAPNATQQ